MKLKNKKSQLGDIISDTVALIVIAFILLIFFIGSLGFLSMSKENIKEQAIENSIGNQEHVSLNNWLQKEIEIDTGNGQQKITIADLIRLTRINPGYRSTLELEKERAFSNIWPCELVFDNENEEGFFIASNETIIINLEIKNEQDE
jgi:hypothetical protein